MDLVSVLIILSAAAVGWAIGASSGSNVISMLVGPHIVNLRGAAVIVSVFLFLGAVFQGGAVTKTIGEDIIPKEELSKSRLAVFSALLASALLILFSIFEAVPLSASQAVVGSIIGCSIVLKLTSKVDVQVVKAIFFSWLLTPVLSLIIAYVIYKIISVPLSKRTTLVAYSETFRVLAVTATAFTAYSIGANNIGNAAGLIISSGSADAVSALFIGAVSMVCGILFHSGRVVRTVSRNITLMDPVTSFTAQLSAGIVTYYFALIGIPISAVQALIGGLVGAGLTKGAGMTNNRLFTQIFIGWTVTPVLAAIFAIGVYEILLFVIYVA